MLGECRPAHQRRAAFFGFGGIESITSVHNRTISHSASAVRRHPARV